MSITGERLKEQRKKLGLSADDVAADLGVSRSTIFRYENGHIEKVPSNILESLSSILSTTPAYLMGWTDDPHDWEQIGNEQGIHPPKDYDGDYEDYVKAKMYQEQDTLIDAYYNTHIEIEDLDEVEKNAIYKYRSIDDKGKHTVNTVLEMEYNRCTSGKETSATYYKVIDHPALDRVAEVREPYCPYQAELIGRVAGGYPILACEEKGNFIPTPVKADFALQIIGDSMEPDYPNMCYLLIKKDYDVADGDIVVASILRAAEIAEATCKKIYLRNGSVELHPTNKLYPVQVYKHEEVKIDGKVIGKVVI